MKAIVNHRLARLRQDCWSCCDDALVVEEPLEVWLRQGGSEAPWLVTMRTPGRDRDLVAGLLFAEGVVTHWQQIRRIVTGCTQGRPSSEGSANRTVVELEPGVPLADRVARATAVSSACGICGRQMLDTLDDRSLPPLPDGPILTAITVACLPERLYRAQKVFHRTGGTHAAGWFDSAGKLLGLAEDVARHNAVDKVIGAALLERQLPVGESILALSGRLSWEILHKARLAGFPVVLSIGAPSSLAVQLAARFEMTLCGFVRDGGFNVYTGPERLAEGIAARLPSSI